MDSVIEVVHGDGVLDESSFWHTLYSGTCCQVGDYFGGLLICVFFGILYLRPAHFWHLAYDQRLGFAGTIGCLIERKSQVQVC